MHRQEPKKPVVLYALASGGMAHATRAHPMLQRLGREYEVHVYCGGAAIDWLRARFPSLHFHRIRRFAHLYIGDRIYPPLNVAFAFLTSPLSLWSFLKVAWVILRKRPVALVTDFEAHATYAALAMRPFHRTRVIEFDNFCAVHSAAPPWRPCPSEREQLERWKKVVKLVVPRADHYLVHAIAQTPLLHAQARLVCPPIRDELLLTVPTGTDGPVVVCLGGTVVFDWLPDVLRSCGRSFVIYGCSEDRDDGAVSLRRFSDEQYVRDLARAPFMIVRGLSSALDAIALEKPVLFYPASGHFEHRYNGRMFESLGIGGLAEELSVETIRRFAEQCEAMRQNIRTRKFFDNEGLFDELQRCIRT